MSLDSLLHDSSKITIQQVAQMVLEHPELFENILQLALEEKPQISNRGMRVICEASQENPEMIKPWLPLLIEKLDTVKIDGLKMNILKIFTFQPFPLDDDQLGKLVGLCFRYISSGLEKPAVKGYSLEILYQAAQKEPGLIPELVARIKNQIPEESCSFTSRSGKIIHNLVFK